MPHVTFLLNRALDKKVAVAFLNTPNGGINFSRGIFNVHPELQKVKKIKNEREKQRLINNYFDAFYSKHDEYLKKRTHEFLKEWGGVERDFLSATAKLFNHYPFPKGKYIGYLSIVDCNPRFIDNKIFQVFYQHPLGVNYVTAHELLHFIFYDYVQRIYPQLFRGVNTETGPLWDFAEIFNSIVLHTQPFVGIHKIKKIVAYPHHRRWIAQMRSIWNVQCDINKFIEAGWKFYTST